MRQRRRDWMRRRRPCWRCAAGQSQWGSELSPLFLQLVLERLQWEPRVCGIMRAVCSTWSSILDGLLPRLDPRGSAAVMTGKLGWYQSVTELDLTRCEEDDVSVVLVELGSMPSLRSLSLPSSCAERAVDAEAVCGLTALTTLCFHGYGIQEVGEWVLDLSRLTTLTTTLRLEECAAVTDKEVLALSNLTGLTDLNLGGCNKVTSEGLMQHVGVDAKQASAGALSLSTGHAARRQRDAFVVRQSAPADSAARSRPYRRALGSLVRDQLPEFATSLGTLATHLSPKSKRWSGAGLLSSELRVPPCSDGRARSLGAAEGAAIRRELLGGGSPVAGTATSASPRVQAMEEKLNTAAAVLGQAAAMASSAASDLDRLQCTDYSTSLISVPAKPSPWRPNQGTHGLLRIHLVTTRPFIHMLEQYLGLVSAEANNCSQPLTAGVIGELYVEDAYSVDSVMISLSIHTNGSVLDSMAVSVRPTQQDLGNKSDWPTDTLGPHQRYAAPPFPCMVLNTLQFSGRNRD
jgi:hypothetical protein